MKKISVIVPVYNAEEKITKCLDSILNQTCQDYEIILINDGSKDNSLKIINTYQEKYPFIKVIDKKNEGVAKTRNLGIQKATGQYIMFIDNDDYIDSDYFETHLNLIEQEQADVVLTGYRRINVDNKILHQEKLKDTPWAKYIITAPWAKIYKRDFLITNNIEFLDYKIGEDVYFNLSLYSSSPKVIISNYIGYNWYFNTKSVSNTSQKGLNKEVDILYLLNKIKTKCQNQDEYLNYYLTRYYIWYLLFSGKKATKLEFIKEYQRIKNWYKNSEIKTTIKPWSKKIQGELLTNRLIILSFLIIEKLHLINLFATFYCRGDKK